MPKPGELRFDMFEGEITHEGDRCSFEVLLGRAGLSDPALQALGDIDLEDSKFGREEATGIASPIAGIAAGAIVAVFRFKVGMLTVLAGCFILVLFYGLLGGQLGA